MDGITSCPVLYGSASRWDAFYKRWCGRSTTRPAACRHPRLRDVRRWLCQRDGRIDSLGGVTLHSSP